MYFVSKMGTLARSCPLPVLPPVFDQGQFLLDRTVRNDLQLTSRVMCDACGC
jgi:hypothetical protein